MRILRPCNIADRAKKEKSIRRYSPSYTHIMYFDKEYLKFNFSTFIYSYLSNKSHSTEIILAIIIATSRRNINLLSQNGKVDTKFRAKVDEIIIFKSNSK